MSAISFNAIADLYDTELGPIVFTPFAKDFVSKIPLADIPSCCRILELAAGTGRLTTELKNTLPTSTLTVTDLSEEMLAVAKSVVENNDRITFIAANMQELPFPDASFDMVVAQFGFMLCTDYAKAFAEARRVLAPGGYPFCLFLLFYVFIIEVLFTDLQGVDSCSMYGARKNNHPCLLLLPRQWVPT